MDKTNKYDPQKHHRRSIRLKGYDYSKPGLYFVTICCQNWHHLFGKIEKDIMNLNDAGFMIEKWYYKTAEKYSTIRCLEMVVMPNHFHCIWQIVDTDNNVRVNSRVHPKQPILGEHLGSPLHRVVQWFKTMTTNEYIRGVKKLNWKPFHKRMWQRNYYEHIIRNEKEYQNILMNILPLPLL